MYIMDELRDDVDAKFERCREALEYEEFKLSRTYMEYMNCNFGEIV